MRAVRKVDFSCVERTTRNCNYVAARATQEGGEGGKDGDKEPQLGPRRDVRRPWTAAFRLISP